jgi:four helix bundle protein
MRDHRKLETFRLADALVLRVYLATKGFPPDERFRMQAQIRRAAVSVPANIVEGSARRSEGEYLQFLHTACASGVELAYLLELSRRLGLLGGPDTIHLGEDADKLIRKLRCQIRALVGEQRHPQRQKP